MSMRIGALTCAVLCATAVWAGESGDTAMNAKAELGQPKVALRLQGEMGRRVDAIVRNWILPAPGANPGMIEMMRLRDRTPPYEDPVPWAGEFVGKYADQAAIQHVPAA